MGGATFRSYALPCVAPAARLRISAVICCPFFEININNLKNNKMIWKKLSNETPMAVKSGNWDGLKSDTLIVATEDDKQLHIAVMYEGFMDGSHFRNFYDEVSEYEIKNVVYWSYVPPLFWGCR